MRTAASVAWGFIELTAYSRPEITGLIVLAAAACASGASWARAEPTKAAARTTTSAIVRMWLRMVNDNHSGSDSTNHAAGLAPAGALAHTMLDFWHRPPVPAMIIDVFRRSAPWQDPEYVDMDHALRVEDTLSRVRVVLFLLSLLVAIVDPLVTPQPVGALLLGVMLLYSLAGMLALRARNVRSPRDVAMFHVVDTAGVLLVLVFTGGAVSPFSTLFLFILLAAGYRWGQPETWFTAAAGVGCPGRSRRVLAAGPGSVVAGPSRRRPAHHLRRHWRRPHRLHGRGRARPAPQRVARIQAPEPRSGGSRRSGGGSGGAGRAHAAVPSHPRRAGVRRRREQRRRALARRASRRPVAACQHPSEPGIEGRGDDLLLPGPARGCTPSRCDALGRAGRRTRPA